MRRESRVSNADDSGRAAAGVRLSREAMREGFRVMGPLDAEPRAAARVDSKSYSWDGPARAGGECTSTVLSRPFLQPLTTAVLDLIITCARIASGTWRPRTAYQSSMSRG